jgi:hypothetical protein
MDVYGRLSTFVVAEYLRFLKTPFQNIKARARRQTFCDRGGTFADAPVTSAFASPQDLLASAHSKGDGSKPRPRTIATGPSRSQPPVQRTIVTVCTLLACCSALARRRSRLPQSLLPSSRVPLGKRLFFSGLNSVRPLLKMSVEIDLRKKVLGLVTYLASGCFLLT